MNRLPFRILAILVLPAAFALTACSPDAQVPEEDLRSSSEVAVADAAPVPDEAPEVVVLIGLDGLIEHLKKENWWGEVNTDEQLTVPHLMIARIHPAWRDVAPDLPVPQKKAIFYRLMLPLIMHANEMVRDRRTRLLAAREALASGESLGADDMERLKSAAILLRVTTEDEAQALAPDSPGLLDLIDEMLYRLDEVPPGLALGQSAYESGYGTSRFAADGNSLFGQWQYGGGGMEPEQKRTGKGNYGVAAYDWPFDSVRGYFINLMSHPAYEDFRRLRAEMRAAGEPLSSLRLADGLVRYSERGQKYVDGLKGIIRVNKLDIADNAVFRDEAMHFIMTEGSKEEAEALQQRIADARASGELAEIYARMRLE